MHLSIRWRFVSFVVSAVMTASVAVACAVPGYEGGYAYGFSGIAEAAGNVVIEVGGDSITVPVGAGDTARVVRDKAAAAFQAVGREVECISETFSLSGHQAVAVFNVMDGRPETSELVKGLTAHGSGPQPTSELATEFATTAAQRYLDEFYPGENLVAVGVEVDCYTATSGVAETPVDMLLWMTRPINSDEWEIPAP